MKERQGPFARAARRLQRAFTANVGLKAASLVLALALAAYNRGAQDEQQRTLSVGLILRLPPDEANRELMRPPPPNLHVTLRGRTRALDPLTKTGLAPIELDLRQGDQQRIEFEPEQMSLPPGVHVNAIEPPSVELAWEDVVERSVPLRAELTGEVAAGFKVATVQVEPQQIAARGPKSLVDVMQFVRVTPYDVASKEGGVHRHQLALSQPPPRVSYLGQNTASVEVTVEPDLTTRRFEKRRVQVVGLPKARTRPTYVDVTVTATPQVADELRAEMIAPRVVLPQAGVTPRERHGSTVGPVVVDLAQASVLIQPPTVTVVW